MFIRSIHIIPKHLPPEITNPKNQNNPFDQTETAKHIINPEAISPIIKKQKSEGLKWKRYKWLKKRTKQLKTFNQQPKKNQNNNNELKYYPIDTII